MRLGMWMTSCPETMGWDSWVFWKKQWVEIWTSTSPVGTAGCACVCWVSELRADIGRTVSIVEIVSLHPRVENLKVKKVIKVSYMNQGVVSVSIVFSDSYALCTVYIFVFFLGPILVNMLHSGLSAGQGHLSKRVRTTIKLLSHFRTNTFFFYPGIE